jgi:hypothetical protein
MTHAFMVSKLFVNRRYERFLIDVTKQTAESALFSCQLARHRRLHGDHAWQLKISRVIRWRM